MMVISENILRLHKSLTEIDSQLSGKTILPLTDGQTNQQTETNA